MNTASDCNNYYGFVYITINLVNSKKYIGQRLYDSKNEWKSYLGSGTLLKRAIAKYGKDNFIKIIIENCNNQAHLNDREKYWINYFNATNSADYYNIALGGTGGNTLAGYTEEQLRRTKMKHSESAKRVVKRGEDCQSSKLTEKEVQEICELLMAGEKSTSNIAKIYKVGNSTIDDIYHKRTWHTITSKYNFPCRKNKRYTPSGHPVVMLDTQGNFVRRFSSAKEAAQFVHANYKTVWKCCTHKIKTCKGYVFQYILE